MKDHDRVTVFEHAVGQHSVKIQGHDDRDVVSQDRACLLQKESFRIILPFARHSTVQCEIRAVNAPSRAERGQELAADTFKVRSLQDPARGNGGGAVRWDQLVVVFALQSSQGSTDLLPQGRVIVEELGA